MPPDHCDTTELMPEFSLRPTGGSEFFGHPDFHGLMSRRVQNILFVSSVYDYFILEQDGRLAERLSSDFSDLNLHYPPNIRSAANSAEAMRILDSGEERVDMVITMLRLGAVDPFTFARQVKDKHPHLPVVLLAHDTVNLGEVLETADLSGIDRVFIWSGDTKLFLVMIKNIEDRLNVDQDIELAHVRVIIVVEDSPFFYSSYLPLLYSELVRQTHAVMDDTVNEAQRRLRVRARPKVLHAVNFEEAVELTQKYAGQLLGVISDIRFPRDGDLDGEAGFRLLDRLRKQNPDLPILLQSSDAHWRERAESLEAGFANKNDPNLLTRIRSFILESFGFGDFVFRTVDGREVARARNVHEMEKCIQSVPIEVIHHHADHNHFSNWLRARTEFDLADRLAPYTVGQFEGDEGVRKFLIASFERLSKRAYAGTVVDFSHQSAPRARFMRIGGGSLGGKARGLAFVDNLLMRRELRDAFDGVRIRVPRVAVIATDIFDEFLQINGLHDLVRDEQATDEIIRRNFLDARLPQHLIGDLSLLLEHFPRRSPSAAPACWKTQFTVRLPVSTPPR
jgi:CheY-like chemotaxis protein